VIFTTPMSYLIAVVLKEHADRVAAGLLRSGAVHFVSTRDLDPESEAVLRSTNLGEERTAARQARLRIESLIRIAELPPLEPQLMDPTEAKPIDIAEINREMDSLVSRVQIARDKQKEIQQDINRLEEVARQLPLLQSGAVELSAGKENRYLMVRVGTVSPAEFDQFQVQISRYPAVVTRIGNQDGQILTAVVSMRRHENEITAILVDRGFREQEIPSGDGPVTTQPVDEIRKKIGELRGQQDEQQQMVEQTVGTRFSSLNELWGQLRIHELLVSVRSQFSGTAHAVLFTGWVPTPRRAALEAMIRDATGGTCHLEWHTASDVPAPAATRVRAPSELRNPKFLRPFQMLVTNFGTPEYGTVDPTALVAVAFLAMFGLMFGDAGHGLVLITLGIIGTLLGRSGRLSAGMVQLSRLVIWCGSAAVITGILFGAYFGFPIFPPLWFDYHGIVAGHAEAGVFSSIFDILTLSIYFGITIIGLGLVLNWINLFRKKRWITLVFDKGGILGGIIYGVGVWAAAYFAASGFRAMPTGRPILLGIGLPALLLFLRFPLEHGKDGFRPGWWLMEWMIELLEIFSGYLANTLSFMRVAGLGIAHVTLMVAFFQIAAMAAPNGQNVVSVAILILGNILVIGLEGLSAGIQSLRLNYYEFFSKYFNTSGTSYKPISMDPSQERSTR
jgi:V/A-type H+-transporting ATPase subunit I